MSRAFSFRDLQLIPALSGYTEIEMLSVEMDNLMLEHLYSLGFSRHAPILYVPNIHRDMRGRVGVGFRAVGEVSQDRTYLKSSMCPAIERLIAASYYDMSLTRELAQLMGNSSVFSNDYATEEDENFPEEWIEPDYEQKAAEILTLEKIRDEIRGTPYNESGALKMPYEY